MNTYPQVLCLEDQNTRLQNEAASTSNISRYIVFLTIALREAAAQEE